VELSGFGQFSVSHRASREGINPRQPSQRITIPELNTPKFKAGQAFKEAVAIKN
jgi:nucleoid DNA-binding protein